ncbi:sensor histidine kinase [Romboutsia weinsteinii]|uniref:histidine kinase n=1 Tax=Romboutsia weinsteinii TaxID=2020949 RepID=A0A371IXG0_9FIRM|nr:HAMP domain-containing sensor histidine kinase [Romboutsia weinsteinii]RDY25162.1 sensor histidine kinase [Romboutsia weinsteinii]
MKIILILLVIVLLVYVYNLKKEIRNISKQLEDYNQIKTRKKIDLRLFDKGLEGLSKNINNHINMHIQSMAIQKSTEEELKRAIANIAHDIRTPLTSVLGYIQMAKKTNLSREKQIECINIAEGRANSLKEILEKFFSFSVIQSPEYNLEIEYVNLNKILYDVIISFYDELKNNNIDLDVSIEYEDLIVLGNKVAINRIIENIITNLIKYSKGEESILLKKENNRAILIISNKVENLNDEDLRLIFDRFYKQDTSRSSSTSSGLGLPIVKTLIEKMSGDIKAELIDNKIRLICRWKTENYDENLND